MADWGALGNDPRVVYQDEHVILICARWQDVELPMVDAAIFDAPYSDRTHGKQRHGRRPEKRGDGEYVSARGIGYSHWSASDVKELCSGIACGGWFVSLTDSELYPAWRDGFRSIGLTAFAPLPCLMPGMNVRLAGDGPSSWAVWCVVGRPRSLRSWGTVPGGYYGNPFDAGENTATATRRSVVVGSKPLWLMQAIVRDYTREGDLILDPCAGSGTTGRAAKDLGRRCIMIEMDPETCEIAAKRLRPHRAWQQELTL